MWQTITAIAVPLISLFIGLITAGGDTRSSRRLKHHIDILNALEKHDDPLQSMRGLVKAEIEALAEEEVARRAKRLNRWNLTLAIILAIATAGMTLWLTWFATNHGSEPFAWVGITFLVAGALLGFLVTIAGFSTIYEPASSKGRTTKADGAAVPAPQATDQTPKES